MRKVLFKGIWYKSHTDRSLAIEISKRNSTVTREFINEFIKANATDYIEGQTSGKKGIKFAQLVAGAEAIVNVTSGNVVSQAEINRRARICSGCKANDPDSGLLMDGVVSTTDCRACGFASKFATWANKLKRQFGVGHVIPNGLADKGCIVCKCTLAVMLPSKMSAFDYEKDLQEKRPSHCWVKKTSNNYIPET